MDLSNDDQNNDNAEHLEQKTLDEDASSPALPTKMVHSRSEGDLSLEEERAKAYNQKNQENNNNGSGGGITSSESFNNFLYWREPLPVLDDIPDEEGSIEDKDEKSHTEKESESKDDETPSTSLEGEDGVKDDQKGNDSIFKGIFELGKGGPEIVPFFFILFWGFFFFRQAKAHDQLTHDGVAVVLMD